MDDILAGKKIIVGISGGIAAYKTCQLVRSLVKRKAEVRVIMTPSALQFITPLTMSTLSGNDVIVNIFPDSQLNGAQMKTWHIEYALWADLMVIAPATINTIAKIANGFADNALTTVAAALRCPLIVCPAADMDMYNNPITRGNIKKIEELLGAFIVEGESGALASGLSGMGRMAEVNKILAAGELVLSGFTKDFSGTSLLVTAGPTYEDIDPVRFIGNRSSGKMGYRIAEAAFLRGARVTLVSGPSSEVTFPEIKVVKVRSAAEMQQSVAGLLPGHDTLIMAAAVADYRPAEKRTNKIKKEEAFASIPLIKNDDILASLAKQAKKIVGFALETDNEVVNALDKLKRKGMDMIVLNSLNDKDSGFEYETNKITVISKTGEKKEFPLASKFITANNILSEIKILF